MNPKTLRLASILLGVLTINTFVGPLVLVGVLRGGERPGWPPDRPIEWVVLACVVGLTLAILGVFARLWVENPRSIEAAKAARRADAPEEGGPG